MLKTRYRGTHLQDDTETQTSQPAAPSYPAVCSSPACGAPRGPALRARACRSWQIAPSQRYSHAYNGKQVCRSTYATQCAPTFLLRSCTGAVPAKPWGLNAAVSAYLWTGTTRSSIEPKFSAAQSAPSWSVRGHTPRIQIERA